MTKGVTVKRRFVKGRGPGSRHQRDKRLADTTAADRVPRISRLMALAIRFEQLICDGVVADQAEIARLGHVSWARLTQIMNLLNLAPDIQEDVLDQLRLSPGRKLMVERKLRGLAAAFDWQVQRRM